MTECLILKDFTFSRNGIDSEYAKAGKFINIPEKLIAGLIDANFCRLPGKDDIAYIDIKVREKMHPGSPENKMITDSEENKVVDIKYVRAQYVEKFGKQPFPGWSIEKLREKMGMK